MTPTDPPGVFGPGRLAKEDFDAALRKGFWRSVFSWLRRSDNQLLPFDEFRRHLPMMGQSDIGMRQIPIDRIVGSVGRYRDFDGAFLPRTERSRPRWESIDRAHIQQVPLPPIEVYKIGEIYFVKDGNHRVSVARERGQVYIDANVIEIVVPFPVDEKTDINALILQWELSQFLEKTELKSLRPNADIHLSMPGLYNRLLDHIQTHGYFMAQDYQREIAWEAAVTSWYDDVYWPLVSVIRQQNILSDFPDRTEADLYLWIIEHLWYLRQEFEDISLEDAALHFTASYAARPGAHPLEKILGGVHSLAVDDGEKTPPTPGGAEGI